MHNVRTGFILHDMRLFSMLCSWRNLVMDWSGIWLHIVGQLAVVLCFCSRKYSGLLVANTSYDLSIDNWKLFVKNHFVPHEFRRIFCRQICLVSVSQWTNNMFTFNEVIVTVLYVVGIVPFMWPCRARKLNNLMKLNNSSFLWMNAHKSYVTW